MRRAVLDADLEHAASDAAVGISLQAVSGAVLEQRELQGLHSELDAYN